MTACIVLFGLIPARAGSTHAVSTPSIGGGAHPRSRGEHGYLSDWERKHVGSSPLARGARLWHGVKRLVSGLIPARAGSTNYVDIAEWNAGAHPRSRGEHGFCEVATLNRLGSSPLARGAPTDYSNGKKYLGLIPARAGSTRRLRYFRACKGAHPRSRGEHIVSGVFDPSDRGSSPLARGALRCLSAGNLDVGLIPARAGSTCE